MARSGPAPLAPLGIWTVAIRWRTTYVSSLRVFARNEPSGSGKAISPRAMATNHRRSDMREIRSRMYGLNREMSGHRLVYLDAAGTTQRLRPAIEAMTTLHSTEN